MSDAESTRSIPMATAAAISEQIAQIHTKSYNTPIRRRVVTHVLDDLVVAVRDIELIKRRETAVQDGCCSCV